MTYKYQARVYDYELFSPAKLAEEASRLGEDGWRIAHMFADDELHRWFVFFESSHEPYELVAHQ